MREAAECLPLIVPLGDAGLLVRFGECLSERANRAAIAFARRVEAAVPAGVVEVVPNLVSVLLRYDPAITPFDRLAGEVRLLVAGTAEPQQGRLWRLPIRFDGEDLPEVAATLRLSVEAFVALHNAAPLRVLATGFAPGFIYCGLHAEALTLPRRSSVRVRVEPGTVLFAAGQTAVTSTAMPTGWHLIGRTAFRNFDVAAMPPSRIVAGDVIQFEAVP